MHCKGYIPSPSWGGKNRIVPANQNINCWDMQGSTLSLLELRKDSHGWEVVLLVTLFPLLSNCLVENKSLKVLQLVLFKEVGVSFLVVNRDYLGKAMDSALLSKCPGCVFTLGTSQANRFGTEWANLPAAAVLGNKWWPNSSLLSLMWMTWGGGGIAKGYSWPFLFQKYRQSHSCEYLRPRWGFSPSKLM